MILKANFLAGNRYTFEIAPQGKTLPLWMFGLRY
jgi:hypothetical protein